MIGAKGGSFEFEDGGVYCGEWEEGKAHGYGVCTGPKGEGQFSGAYNFGFEVSGVYTMPRGSAVYEGQWQNGKKHGLGVEYHSRYIYYGEWNQGTKGRYGVRHSKSSAAKYEGTWSEGLQDGYGTETYADGGIYQGQWLRGMRHGYGIRRSVPYGVAAQYSEPKQTDEHASCSSLHSDQEGSITNGRSRGGFVLKAGSNQSGSANARRSQSEQSISRKRFLFRRMRKQRSAEEIDQAKPIDPKRILVQGSGSSNSCASEEATGAFPLPQSVARLRGDLSKDTSFDAEENIDPNVTETYMGEWKNDKRSGFGISERSDGLKYEGEWFNNKKYGYGVTTFKEGTVEAGKYKNNLLLSSIGHRKNALFLRHSKMRERIDSAVSQAGKAAQLALQKADVGGSRTSTARERADAADIIATQAKEDSGKAKAMASKFDSSFTNHSGHSIAAMAQAQDAGLTNHVGHMAGMKPPVSSTLPNAPSGRFTPSPDSHQGRPSPSKNQGSLPPASSSHSHRGRSLTRGVPFVPKFEALPSESPSDDSGAMFTPPDIPSPSTAGYYHPGAGREHPEQQHDPGRTNLGQISYSSRIPSVLEPIDSIDDRRRASRSYRDSAGMPELIVHQQSSRTQSSTSRDHMPPNTGTSSLDTGRTQSYELPAAAHSSATRTSSDINQNNRNLMPSSHHAQPYIAQESPTSMRKIPGIQTREGGHRVAGTSNIMTGAQFQQQQQYSARMLHPSAVPSSSNIISQGPAALPATNTTSSPESSHSGSRLSLGGYPYYFDRYEEYGGVVPPTEFPPGISAAGGNPQGFADDSHGQHLQLPGTAPHRQIPATSEVLSYQNASSSNNDMLSDEAAYFEHVAEQHHLGQPHISPSSTNPSVRGRAMSHVPDQHRRLLRQQGQDIADPMAPFHGIPGSHGQMPLSARSSHPQPSIRHTPASARMTSVEDDAVYWVKVREQRRQQHQFVEHSTELGESNSNMGSLPDLTTIANSQVGLTREEISHLSSRRRGELIRQQILAEQLRANPLNYLFQPHIVDWVSRNKIMLLLASLNVLFALIFYILLTRTHEDSDSEENGNIS